MTEDVSSIQVDAEPVIDAAIKTPGALLQEARLARKLSQADVAKHLHLSQQWIKDIENDDYAKAAAIIYVRGHLRSYARFVGLLPDDIIAAFESLSMEAEFDRVKSLQERPVMRQSVPVISKSRRTISRRFVRWATTSALIILIVLVGVWWQGQKKHTASVHPQAVLQSKEALTIEPSSMPDQSVPVATPVVNSVTANERLPAPTTNGTHSSASRSSGRP